MKTSLSTYIKIIEDIASDINDLSLDEILIRIYKDSKLKTYFSEQKGEESISKQENIEELLSQQKTLLETILIAKVL